MFRLTWWCRVRGRLLVLGTNLEVDGCGVSLWETEAVLGAVDREVFSFLTRIFSRHYPRLAKAADGLGLCEWRRWPWLRQFMLN